MTGNEQLTKLKHSRQGYRLNIKKTVDEITELHDGRDVTEIDRSRFTVLSDRLTNYATQIETLNAQIFDLTPENDIAEETDSCMKMQEVVWEAQSKITILMGPPPEIAVGQSHVGLLSADGQGSTVASGHHTKQAKLPKLEMTKFSGDPLEWQSYWDNFESTIDHSDLPKIDKFKYLKSTLEGDAEKMVNGFRMIEANYEPVVECLKERFGNKDVAVNAHFEQLLGLPIATFDLGSLQSVYDQCERHVRSLVALGLDESTFGVVFAPIILSKLPKGIRVELHRQNGSQSWDISKLRELFKSELKARQMGEWSLDGKDKGAKGGPNGAKAGQGGKPRTGQPQPTSTFMQQGGRASQDRKDPGNQGKGKQGRQIICTFCRGLHFSDECQVVPDYPSRKVIALRGKLCFRCLSNKHQIKQCPKPAKCYHCGEDSHHTALCAKKGKGSNRQISTSSMLNPSQGESNFGPQSGTSSFGVPTGQGHPRVSFSLPSSVGYASSGQSRVGLSPSLDPNASTFAPRHTSSHAAAADGSSVHLQMAQIVFASGKKSISARVFLDPGSSSSYIVSSLSNQLGLKPYGSMVVSNARFGDGSRKVNSYKTVVVPIPTQDGSIVDIDAFVTDKISAPIQKLPLAVNEYPILRNIPLADTVSTFPEFVSIDILIGGDFYFDFVGCEQIRLGKGLLLLGSRFGYIPVGRDGSSAVSLTEKSDSTMFIATMLNFSSKNHRVHNPDIERFWSLEDVGVVDDPLSKDDDLAVQHFNKHIQKIDNRYVAAFPWKEENPDLLDNYDMALARLRNQARRLQKTPEFLTDYDDILQKQVKLGIIKEVAPNVSGDTSLCHYLPHHAVIKPSSATTKVRIVHDASAKSSKDALSLNDCLFRGPVFLGDICGLLLRFRLNPVGFVCDIEKALFQVGLRDCDRDVTRFLWLRDPCQGVTPQNLVTYRFARVPFGVISSPFLLGATVKHHLLQNDSAVSHDIASNIYVDNIISGADSTEKAREYYEETQRVFNEISMNVREWFTNDKDFFGSIQKKHQGAGSTNKVLGMVWNTEADGLSFSDPKFDKILVRSKRNLIQAVSRAYDPCGLLAPVLTKAKVLVQDAWRKQIKWDEPLPAEMLETWANIKSDMMGISGLGVPRFIGAVNADWDIHCFCDASSKAYAAAVYLRSSSGVSHLVFSKCRLAPLKTISLPRLELMAVVTGVRLITFVKTQLRCNFSRTVAWTDSKCVLHWISSSKVLSTFVSNRVRQINAVPCEFRYVPTSINPADIPTRGLPAKELAYSSLWFNGPQFLESPESEWPATLLGSTDIGYGDETPIETMVAESSVEVPSGPLDIDASRFSSLGRLLRITAYAYRFVHKLLGKVKCRSSRKTDEGTVHLWIHEIRDAKIQWVRQVQKDVEQGKGFANLKRQLDLFKDSNGIWRCNGRLHHANVSDDTKFPILLTKSHPFTTLVIKDCHQRVHHSGQLHTLAELRSAFWVPNGKTEVNRVIQGCQICRLWEGGSYKTPPFPPLPSLRVNRAPPFAYTGVDYLGPLMVSNDGSARKVWICLFTCAVTRAIHLEVVANLSTYQFLLCLRRFIASFGRPEVIISDNGKYFKLANDVLKRLWAEICKSPNLYTFLTHQDIQWKFITEYSPWMGGFYERLVGSVKRSLKKILGRKAVTFEQLQTVVAEVSAVLNSRPLVLSNDVRDQILSPSDLLGKRVRTGMPSSVSEDIKDQTFVPNPNLASDLIRSWKENDSILNQFWDIWQRQYLTALRERSSKQKTVPGAIPIPVKVGVPVLVHQDKMPRAMWKVGVISEVKVSGDGSVRTAVVRLPTGKELTRPVRFLYPLEVQQDNKHTHQSPHLQKSKLHDTFDHVKGLEDEGDICPSASTNAQNADDDISHAAASVRRPQRKAAEKASKMIQLQLLSSENEDEMN